MVDADRKTVLRSSVLSKETSLANFEHRQPSVPSVGGVRCATELSVETLPPESVSKPPEEMK